MLRAKTTRPAIQPPGWRRVTDIDVVFVITDLQSTRFLGPVVSELARRGLRCGLITNLHGQAPSQELRDGLVWWDSVPLRRSPSPVWDLLHLLRLWFVLARVRPRVVACSTPKAGLLGTSAGRLARVPCCLYQVRGFRAETSTGGTRAVLGALERITLACAHRVVFNSASLRDAMEASGLRAGERGLVVGRGSSVGVDCERFTPADPPDNGDEPVIGFIGRLHSDKGLADLLTAFEHVRRSVPGARLVVVGGIDPTDPGSAALAATLSGAPGVSVEPPTDDVAGVLARLDVLGFPSRREGLPNVVLEAQACGVPVVGYEATGVVDAVESGCGGVLVAVDDVDRLGEALVEVLSDPELSTQMRRDGRRFVEEHFERGKVVAAQADLYQKLCAS